MAAPASTLDEEMEEMVKITPKEIVFKIDPNASSNSLKSTSSFKLTNINKEMKIGFKLKTNQLKLYLLKPTIGVIEIGKSIDIGLIFTGKIDQVKDLFTAKHAIRVDSYKITPDMEPFGDIKELIKNLSEKTRKRKDIIKIIFKTITQDGDQVQQDKMKKSIYEPNLEAKKEHYMKTAQLNSLNTQLGDLNLKHQQLKKATQKEDAGKQSTTSVLKINNSQSNIGIPIAVFIFVIAFIIGYHLTK